MSDAKYGITNKGSDGRVRILIVDDHALMRAGLANMLNANPLFHVVAEAPDGATAIDCYGVHMPDIVLMDVIMPVKDGIVTTKELRDKYPEAKVLMLTSSEMKDDIVRSMQVGACGYVTKTALPAELSTAILTVHHGGRALTPAIESLLSEHAISCRITPREIEVLTILRKGLSNSQIGEALGISTRTAKAHVESLLVKLDATDRTEAVARGFERGLLRP